MATSLYRCRAGAARSAQSVEAAGASSMLFGRASGFLAQVRWALKGGHACSASLARQPGHHEDDKDAEGVVLVMQHGPQRRRQDDRARDAEPRRSPAAVQEAAEEQFLGYWRNHDHREPQQRQRAGGLGRAIGRFDVLGSLEQFPFGRSPIRRALDAIS